MNIDKLDFFFFTSISIFQDGEKSSQESPRIQQMFTWTKNLSFKTGSQNLKFPIVSSNFLIEDMP